MKTGIAIWNDTPHWIDVQVFGTVRGINVDEIVRVKLYTAEAAESEHMMAAVRAHAARVVKRRVGLSTCTASRLLAIGYRDWSDSLNAAFNYPAQAAA